MARPPGAFWKLMGFCAVVICLLSLCAYRAAWKAPKHPDIAKIHPIFEEKYEIKSCLSPDLATHEETSCRFFALMIDAGSTGTRLHVFEFSHDTQRPASPFKLESETFEEVKPGLSGFVKDPREAGDGIEKLILKAKATVPKNMWRHTPLALKATAGVRLLSSTRAEKILDVIEDLFESSPFLINTDSVTIMSGTDEGIFGWFTLNYLMDRIDAVLQSPEELVKMVSENLTAAALDLGGGSTQVTFRPLRTLTLSDSPSDHLKQIRMFNKKLKLYTHSYLGNGLLAMRLSTLSLSTRRKAKEKSYLYTNCLPQGYEFTWNYTKEFVVRGTKHYDFNNCWSDVIKFLETCQIHATEELKSRDLFAFGYFFDRGSQAGLVKDSNGGSVTVGDFKIAAQKACSNQKIGPVHWMSWQCLDLTYIYTLLSRGYKLPDEKEIFLTKKLRNLETSWALGASYHLLNTYHEANEATKSASGIYSGFCFYFCTRIYSSLCGLMSYFQLLA